MKNILFSFSFLLILNYSVYSQEKIYHDVVKYINASQKDKLSDKKYTIIIISHSECGHCLIAYDRIKQLENKINIIIIDYSNLKKEDLKSKYKSYVFLNGSDIKEISYPDFFPKLYLFDKRGNLIWKKKGWFEKNLKQINSKLPN